MNKILVSYWWIRPNGANTYIEEYASQELLDSVYNLEDLKSAYLKSKGLSSIDITNWGFKIEHAPKFQVKRDWLEEGNES